MHQQRGSALLRKEFQEAMLNARSAELIHSTPGLLPNDILFHNQMHNNQNQPYIINIKHTRQ